MTNGEVLKMLFPDIEPTFIRNLSGMQTVEVKFNDNYKGLFGSAVHRFSREWWEEENEEADKLSFHLPEELEEESIYTDLRTLKIGTRFRVENGCWAGKIIVKDEIKCMHIYDTGEDVPISGREQLVITILK